MLDVSMILPCENIVSQEVGGESNSDALHSDSEESNKKLSDD